MPRPYRVVCNANDPQWLEERRKLELRFMNKVKVGDGCWEWTAVTRGSGYGGFKLGGRMRGAHRVSYELYVGTIPQGVHVLHKCDNPRCVRPGHLFLGTHQDNMQDRAKKGRSNVPKGEYHTSSKLTTQSVVEIRDRVTQGEQLQTLADEFKITKQSVWAVVHRKSWKHV